MEHCVLSVRDAANNDNNDDPSSNKLLSLSKTQNYMPLSSLLQQKTTKKYENF